MIKLNFLDGHYSVSPSSSIYKFSTLLSEGEYDTSYVYPHKVSDFVDVSKLLDLISSNKLPKNKLNLNFAYLKLAEDFGIDTLFSSYVRLFSDMVKGKSQNEIIDMLKVSTSKN